MDEVVLYINRWDSRCGACNRGVLPDDVKHETPCGWGQHEGCGAEFTAVSSDYSDDGRLYERIREMRPDLPFLNPMTGERVEASQ